VGASIAAAVGCKRRPADSRLKLKVAVVPQLTMSPVHLAVEMGYFEQAGVDVSLVEIAGASQILVLLAGGEVDVSFASLSSSFLNAVGRGSKVRIVAGRTVLRTACETGDRLYVRRSDFPGGFKDLRWLRGKRVAISRKATATEFFLDTILGSAGMSQRDVHVSTLARAEAVAALISGRIDAVMDHQFERDVQEVTRQVIRGPRVGELLPEFQYAHVLFGARLLGKDLQPGVGLLAGYLRGSREFLGGRTPKFMDDFARANKLDPARTRAVCRNFFTTDGSIQIGDLDRFVSWASDKGYLAAPLHAADLVDGRFLAPAQRLSKEIEGQRI
jgi:ABC-type nitrate/sulfonate/bicarbonate transport system substrate-binding protein